MAVKADLRRRLDVLKQWFGRQNPPPPEEADELEVDDDLAMQPAIRARDQFEHFMRDTMLPLERAWNDLEHRTDFAADNAREQLRPKLAAAYDTRDRLAKRLALTEDLADVLRTLMTAHARQMASTQAQFERLSAHVDAPAPADFAAFQTACRVLEKLRLSLFAATRAPEFSRQWDGLQELKRHWEDVHSDRQRLFDITGPGARPRGDGLHLDGTRRAAELLAALYKLEHQEQKGTSNGR